MTYEVVPMVRANRASERHSLTSPHREPLVKPRCLQSLPPPPPRRPQFRRYQRPPDPPRAAAAVAAGARSPADRIAVLQVQHQLIRII